MVVLWRRGVQLSRLRTSALICQRRRVSGWVRLWKAGKAGGDGGAAAHGSIPASMVPHSLSTFAATTCSSKGITHMRVQSPCMKQRAAPGTVHPPPLRLCSAGSSSSKLVFEVRPRPHDGRDPQPLP